MVNKWNLYKGKLDSIITPYLEKNIIIFGCNKCGYFLKHYLSDYYNKEIKAMVDFWERSPSSTILHLYSLFYLYDVNDIIINVTNYDIIEEFEKAGENWNEIRYDDNQIINILSLFYDDYKRESIDYYNWLESFYKVDFNNNIRRKNVDGEDAHGYYPTEFRVLSTIFKDYNISELDAAFDFGCGKGAFLAMLNQFGFNKVAGVEYTLNIYNQLVRNMQFLSLKFFENRNEIIDNGIYLFNDDAAKMGNVLDSFSWFCFFNPFGIKKTKEVISNILDSLDRNPRKIHILYAEPMGDYIIMTSNRFIRKEYCIDFYEGTYWTYVYTSID
jgi:SAM-dependent methyltransferase